jgi:hypothetical protein
MLAEMLEMLGPDAGADAGTIKMMAIEKLVIEMLAIAGAPPLK